MKKVLVITLLLVIAMMLQAQNPPRNFQAVAGNGLVTLTWDTPIIDDMLEIRYHDSNPYNGYYQHFDRGYGVVFDLTGYENPVLEQLDFRHTSYGITGVQTYNLHIVDMDEMTALSVIEELETTVEDGWETEISLGELAGVDHLGIFLEPLGYLEENAYPVLDCDPHCDYISYVVNINNNYDILVDPADGDFLMDLWISADEFGRTRAVKVPKVERTISSDDNILRTSRPGISIPEPLNRDLVGYFVYRNGYTITPSPIDETSYIDTDVVNGTTYEYWVTARYSDGSESDSTSHQTVTPSLPQGVLFTEGFEAGIPTSWTVIDADGDNYNWAINDSSVDPHDGNRCVYSASYINNIGSLNPDNWLITPAIDLTIDAHLYFWVVPQDPDWPNEHYYVKLSTTGTAIEDFDVLLLDETITYTSWVEKDIDLSAYTGETVYIAFEHCEVTDMFYLVLDDVSVENRNASDEESIATPTLTTSSYPNPFNPETTISFNLPEKSQTSLEVFNIRGQKVTTLLNERIDAGQHQVVWHGTDQNGSPVSSGIYFYKLNTNGTSLVRKIALMK